MVQFYSLHLRAVVLNDADASYSLAEARTSGDFFGLSVRPDLGTAARWYLRGARRGHRHSQYELGFMYLQGEGVEQDCAEGVKWISEAAEAGHDDAMRVLVDGYSSGVLGIEPNESLANRWSERLAAHLESHPQNRRSYESG